MTENTAVLTAANIFNWHRSAAQQIVSPKVQRINLSCRGWHYRNLELELTFMTLCMTRRKLFPQSLDEFYIFGVFETRRVFASVSRLAVEPKKLKRGTRFGTLVNFE